MARSRLPELRFLRPTVSRVLILSVFLAAGVQAQVREVDYGPTVLEITGPVLAAFEKGLRAEIALREALRKQAANRPSQDQYKQCLMTKMMTPGSLKFLEALSTVTADAKPEEMMPRMMRYNAAQAARMEAKCGPDPGYGNDQVTMNQLEAIEQKAASVAGPIPADAKKP